MLKAIKEALLKIENDYKEHLNNINDRLTSLMRVIEYYPLSAKELMNKLKLKSRDGFRNNYLIPALEAGLIGMTNPDKPTSRNQRYFKI